MRASLLVSEYTSSSSEAGASFSRMAAKIFRISEEHSVVELYMEVAEDTGIVVRGETDADGNFHVAHYFPIHRGKGISSQEAVYINKRVDTDAFTGMCDDYRIGVSLIFYVQNAVDLLKSPITRKDRNKYISRRRG